MSICVCSLTTTPENIMNESGAHTIGKTPFCLKCTRNRSAILVSGVLLRDVLLKKSEQFLVKFQKKQIRSSPSLQGSCISIYSEYIKTVQKLFHIYV